MRAMARTMPPGKITSEKPSACNLSRPRIGVRPPSTMFAISGGPSGKARAIGGQLLLAARRLDEQHVRARLGV